jgi:hypothetical protein
MAICVHRVMRLRKFASFQIIIDAVSKDDTVYNCEKALLVLGIQIYFFLSNFSNFGQIGNTTIPKYFY